MALPDLNALIAKWGPEEGNRRWMVQMSNQGYSFAPSVDFIRQASGMSPMPSGLLAPEYANWFPARIPVFTPRTSSSPMTSISSPAATASTSPIPASPEVVAPTPVADAAAQVAGASKPVVPQFVVPYAKPSGPGAFGESDVNPFYTNKKMF